MFRQNIYTREDDRASPPAPIGWGWRLPQIVREDLNFSTLPEGLQMYSLRPSGFLNSQKADVKFSVLILLSTCYVLSCKGLPNPSFSLYSYLCFLTAIPNLSGLQLAVPQIIENVKSLWLLPFLIGFSDGLEKIRSTRGGYKSALHFIHLKSQTLLSIFYEPVIEMLLVISAFLARVSKWGFQGALPLTRYPPEWARCALPGEEIKPAAFIRKPPAVILLPVKI